MKRFAFAFLSGSPAGRVFALEVSPARVGRPPDGERAPADSDATVSAVHAILERRQAGWTLRDAGSRTRLAAGESIVLAEGEGILFGTGGAAARFQASAAPAPRSWIAVEPEGAPERFAVEVDLPDPTTLGTIRFVGPTVAHTASAFPVNSDEVVGALSRAPLVSGDAAAETFSMAIRSDAVLRFLETTR